LLQVLKELIKSSAHTWPSAEQLKSLYYLLSIFGQRAELSREMDRIKNELTNASEDGSCIIVETPEQVEVDKNKDVVYDGAEV